VSEHLTCLRQYCLVAAAGRAADVLLAGQGRSEVKQVGDQLAEFAGLFAPLHPGGRLRVGHPGAVR
jgi:hypothetical protein